MSRRRRREVTLVATGAKWTFVAALRALLRFAGLELLVTAGPQDAIRDCLVALGPTFIKLGQILSARADLLPASYASALSSLQDHVDPVPLNEIRAVLMRDLDRDPFRGLAEIDVEPLASASIGQVHSARLPSGREVAIKLHKPRVERAIEDDLAILERVSGLVSALHLVSRRMDLRGLAQEFARTIRAELDYLSEGANADRLRDIVSPLGVHVPEIVWELTSSQMLTMERIFGVKIDDVTALDELGIDRRRVARDFANVYLTMVFVHGFFHADPHPGNIFVESDGALAMVDFGMIGDIDAQTRAVLVEMLIALATGDALKSAHALRDLGATLPDMDLGPFAQDLHMVTSKWLDVSVGQIKLGELLREFTNLIRRYRLFLPTEIALLLKTVVMCEGVAARLDPEFSLAPLLVQVVQAQRAALRPARGVGGPSPLDPDRRRAEDVST